MTTSNRAQSGFAEINGTRLYYEITGEGRPLVMLHGGLVNLRSWDSQVVALAPHYRVIRYDLHGCGKSGTPKESFSPEQDLHDLLGFLGIERASFLGLSYGGRTLINFTLLHPEMVETLILAASSLADYMFSDSVKQVWDEADAACESGDIPLASEIETRLWIVGPERTQEEVDPVVFNLVKEWNTENLRKAIEGQMADPIPVEPSALNRLSEIQVPTLVIVGDKDLAEIQAIAQKLAQEIPNARKVVIPNTAHALNMEQPATFNEAVLSFLENVPEG